MTISPSRIVSLELVNEVGGVSFWVAETIGVEEAEGNTLAEPPRMEIVLHQNKLRS